MTITDIVLQIVLPIVIPVSVAIIIFNIRRHIHDLESDAQDTRDQIMLTDIMLYNRRLGLKSEDIVIPKQIGESTSTEFGCNSVQGMFQNCANLTSIPQLTSATDLSTLFKGCTQRTVVKQKYQTFEEQRIEFERKNEEQRSEFERKNKEDWDSYHDPSRYIR